MADYKPIRPIKLSGRALYDDEQMIRPIKLSGRASYDAGQIPRAELPGHGAPGPRTGDTRGSYLAPGRSAACARRVPLTSGDILHFLVQ